MREKRLSLGQRADHGGSQAMLIELGFILRDDGGLEYDESNGNGDK